MFKSNIIAESNVFFSETESTYLDSKFVVQIDDYEKLKIVEKCKKSESRIAQFSNKQRDILKTDMRCVYAKNDPCWGYSKDANGIVCDCLNGECPQIKKCNPDYNMVDAVYWNSLKNENKLYGDPKKLLRYFKVDMISDEEMNRYDVLPRNEGLEYPMIREKIVEDKKKKTKEEKYRINPITGKREVIIGYRWVFTDNASYESQELVPIWGEVDEYYEKKIAAKKAKKIEKLEEEKKQKTVRKRAKKKNIELNELKEKYLLEVQKNIKEEHNLLNVDEKYVVDEMIILFDNPAEMGYVSNMLMQSYIEHGYSVENEVRLMLIDDFKKKDIREDIWVTNNVLKRGCKDNNVASWEVLSTCKSIVKLEIPHREYAEILSVEGQNRWCCKNMQGVTHICINESDFTEVYNKVNGEYEISIVIEENQYTVIDYEGNEMACLNNDLREIIEELDKREEIREIPYEIQGMKLLLEDGKISILGIGRLKFLAY